MKFFLTFIVVLTITMSAKAQGGRKYINFLAMHQQIDNTLKEHNRQEEIRKKAEENLLIEQQNKSRNKTLKGHYEAIRGRLNKVQPFIQAIPVGVTMYNSINDIIRTQGKIIDLLAEAPYGVVQVYQPYVVFVEDAYDTLALAAGIIVSYGTISQMEQDDRMTLLNYTQKEFGRLAYQSSLMYSKLRLFINQQKYRNNRLDDWIQKDKQLIEDIMDNARGMGL